MVSGILGGGLGFFKGNLNLLKSKKHFQNDRMGLFKESLMDALKYLF